MTAADAMLAEAVRLHALGYQPVPLTVSGQRPKGTPPVGRTGYAGRPFTRAELGDLDWRRRRLAIRLPEDVVGVDVDVYNGGDRGLAELEARFGPLPPTVMSHNGRGDGSGIRLFRVPRGTTLRTDPAAGIDMVQYFHRYVIAAPSLHPSGRQYAWHDQADDDAVDGPPEVGELPQLPWAWVEGLAAAKAKKAATAATSAEVAAFLEQHTGNKRPKALDGVKAKLAEATSGHDTALTVACWALREAAAGWYPAKKAVAVLEEWWGQYFATRRDRTPGAGELAGIIVWAVAEVLADPEAVAALADQADEPKSSTKRQLLGGIETHYTVGRSDDDRPFLIANDGPNVALFSGAAKADIARRCYVTDGTVPPRAALDETWLTVEGMAHGTAKVTLPLRVAACADGYVIDCGNAAGHAVVVTAAGWGIVERSPVTFRRSKAQLPLELPVTGGTVDELFDLLNVGGEFRELFTAWLVAALIERLPHPIAVLRGQQGAAKTTTARCITRLIDPCMAATQRPPKADDDWAQACAARWVVAVDNVSRVSDWWSDALCRTVTGDGWLRRQLYTDDDVVVSSFRRVLVLNGISLGAELRPDLAERLVLFELERPSAWLTEAEVDQRLDAMRPRVLGALLDRLAATLAALPVVDIPRDARMADWAHLLAAYDHAHGTTTLAAYRVQLDAAFDEALEADPLAAAVIAMMREQPNGWSGRASELLAELARHRVRSDFADDTRWPSTAGHLVAQMNRSGPLLHRVGIRWHRPQRNRTGSAVRLSWLVTDTGDACDARDAHFSFVATSEGDSAYTRASKGESASKPEKTQQVGNERHERHGRHTATSAEDTTAGTAQPFTIVTDEPW